MPKIFGNFKRQYLLSEEISSLINKANMLTDGEYKLYDVNADSLERILDRILVIARQEKEWYCYFFTLFEMLYVLYRNDKCIKILKYAEIFYRDSAVYMDTAVLNYPYTDIGEYSTWSYNIISYVYRKFPQITDEKMEAFMEQYKEAVKKYGGEKAYYEDELKLALMYKDIKRAKQAKEGLEHSEIGSCYLCAMKSVFGYYLLCEDYENLERMVFQFRTRTIPAKHRWCYKYCHLAEDRNLILDVLEYCLMVGRSEYFYKLLKENNKLFQIKDEDAGTSEFYVYACLGDWTSLQDAVELAEDDTEDWKKGEQSAVGHMYDCLCWYCYFTMLDSAGTHEVATKLAGKEVPEIESAGEKTADNEASETESATDGEKCSCLELAAYFEREADKIGGQMEASRKMYDYGALKQSYMECIGMIEKA